MIARVVECSDYNVFYGILEVKNISIEEVQEKIYEIKQSFDENNIDDWTIEDIFNQFPIEWDWNYETNVGTIDI